MPERKTPVGGDNRDTDHFKQSKDIFFFFGLFEKVILVWYRVLLGLEGTKRKLSFQA